MSDEMNEQQGRNEDEGQPGMDQGHGNGQDHSHLQDGQSQSEGPKGPTGPTYGIFESLRVYPVPSTTSKVAGYVSCKIKTELGYIFLNSMALVWGNNGLFLSFPSRKKENSPRGHEDYYFFEREMREKLQEHAILEYKNKGGNMIQPALPQPNMGPPMGPPPRQPYPQQGPPPRYNNQGGGYGGGGGYNQGGGGGYGGGYPQQPPRYNNQGGGYGGGGGGYGMQGGGGRNNNNNNFNDNFGNSFNNNYGGPPRRPMSGGYGQDGPPRRPMSSGSDYTQRPPRDFNRLPQRPPQNPTSGNQGGEFGTTPIKDEE